MSAQSKPISGASCVRAAKATAERIGLKVVGGKTKCKCSSQFYRFQRNGKTIALMGDHAQTNLELGPQREMSEAGVITYLDHDDIIALQALAETHEGYFTKGRHEEGMLVALESFRFGPIHIDAGVVPVKDPREKIYPGDPVAGISNTPS